MLNKKALVTKSNNLFFEKQDYCSNNFINKQIEQILLNNVIKIEFILSLDYVL